MSESVEIKVTGPGVLPEYQTKGSAGADISACMNDAIIIEPGKFAVVPTGLFLEIPAGYEVQIRPRSGLAAKNGVTVLNTPGTIDSDYRGELKVILINLGSESYIITPGYRIAQMVVAPVIQASFKTVNELGQTERGEGGFGSTGK